ncbi:LysR family transcriptional regulator [Azomonas macrocytogenes]|uniref:DNA-binding transcriptional LysR family regulator n=1 Tax=Azomonas macrocytogenes TaxID=69962 RepID=A0A839SYJ0_AZOMA|nr:LysR family transcriptional regulator [Azomonas macrocytogenes]MBB3101958.1 DNA-binding transcriptional LysR family regulator [Azomonas macrocytogenes]
MDIKQLQFLCALDHYGHFSHAADACHVTQPTLSMRLKRLEEELGVPLVLRNQRFEGFTPEGKRLLAWARQVVNAYDGMKTEANRLKGTLVGTLRIGMVPLSHVCLLPLLKLLREQAPQVRYQLHALSSGSILERIDNNTLDVGLTYLPQIETDRCRILPLGSPAIGLLYHPALFEFTEGDGPLDWNRIAEVPLGLLSTSMRFRQGIDSSAAAHGVVLQPVIESDAVDHLIECVNTGLCCTLIPLPAPTSPLFDQLRVEPLAVALNQLPLALICRSSELNPLTRALMQQAEQWINAQNFKTQVLPDVFCSIFSE